MKRGFGPPKGIKILFFVIAFLALFSFIVMQLWNAILPDVLNVNTINFWQALGILVLSKILFGFGGPGGGGFGHKRRQWRERMQQKWNNMTPEERTRFRQSWKARCGKWGGPFGAMEPETQQDSSTPGEEKQEQP